MPHARRPTPKNESFILCRFASAVAFFAPNAHADCGSGTYGSGKGDFVVVVSSSDASHAGQRYLLLDGRRGSTSDPGAPVACVDESILVASGDNPPVRWEKIPMRITETTFSSVETSLAGRLIEPGGETSPARPLVVLVHGSENASALNSPYPYPFALAAQGIAVFVYDKRGTGSSKGEYTQNFELLAADAAAALAHARSMAPGRIDRAGFYGGSQAGWVAPLAATRSKADFVAVGFGLVTSPIEEDREEMIYQAHAMGLDKKSLALIDRLSRATSRLLLSDFKEGYDDLAKVRRELAGEPWLKRIHGEHSGDMLRMSDEDLRRYGRPRFDNLELIWDYDSKTALKRLNAPLLWVLAEQDQEAPIETTRAALLELVEAGKPIEIFLFPDTDHGMVEFITTADGTRTYTRVTEGYLRLVGDWIKGQVSGSYGRGRKL